MKDNPGAMEASANELDSESSEANPVQMGRREFTTLAATLGLSAGAIPTINSSFNHSDGTTAAIGVNEEIKTMDKETLLKTAYGMPLMRPGFAPTGTRFVDRETMKIFYRTDAEALRRWVPEPLKIVDPIVAFEIVKMNDASGCGVFHESGQMVQVELDGVRGNFVHMLFLDNLAAILAGREIFGFPKKLGAPNLVPDGDALLGTLDVGRVRVATATMGYKYHEDDLDSVRKETEETRTFLLKMLPDVDASLKVCQLVQCSTINVVMKGAWHGPGALHLTPHALAPLTALPVLEVVKATHTMMDMNYGDGKVVQDYLA